MGIKRALGKMLGFSADPAPRPIADVILEMNARGLLPRAGRPEALSVPAVLRARNLICSTATLPLVQRDGDQKRVRLPLLEQIDPDVANVVTLSQTLEDLIFEGLSWWRVLALGADGYPVYAQHLDFSSVQIQQRTGWPAPLPGGFDPRGADIYVNGELIADPAAELIRFDSPNPGLLHSGGRTIRRAVLLDTTSALYADNPRPLDYFSPTEGADPATDQEVQQLLDDWNRARKNRTTAYVPYALKYNAVDTPTPADLQLIEQQRKAALDIANMTGLDPEDLGVSTTSRTYQNATDRRQDRINDTYAPYMAAIAERLSMGDVTKRGYRVGFDLDKYLRVDPLTRAKVYQLAGVGPWMDADEARAEEEMPPLTAAQRASLAPPAQPAQLPDNVVPIRRTANMGAEDSDLLVFSMDALPPLHVDMERRIIEGVVVPYGADKIARKNGYRWRFQMGSLVPPAELKRNKALRDHDNAQPLGYLVYHQERPEGMFARYKIKEGPDGDRALAEARDGIRDGFSVGTEINDAIPDPLNQGVYLVAVGGAAWRETSLLAVPAFDDARVTRVAAGADKGDQMETCATCGASLTPGAAHTCPPPAAPVSAPPAPTPANFALNPEQTAQLIAMPGVLQALAGVPAAQSGNAGPNGPANFALSQEQIGVLVGIPGVLPMLLGQGAPVPQPEQRERVNPVRPGTATTFVREEEPYRFDRKGNLTRGKFDFSTDLIAGFGHGDVEALERAQSWMRKQFSEGGTVEANFATAMSDVTSLNPNIQRPDLYVDQKEFQYPIWSAIEKGTIGDATPFTLPKFNTSSGLVGAHTENTEPTPGTFTATSQTITPSAVSGKVEISREAWDQGGNPQLSGLIWRQMVRGWFEALEASAVTLLEGAAPTTITITTAAADSALEASITSQLAPLQYVRGGFSMRDFFVQVDLYKALIAAKDSNGRKLFPYIGAANATGTMSAFFAAVEVAGLVGKPAWALAATSANSANSYLIDRDNVSGWATAPQRLTMENISVAKIHMGIWGYKALAITDLTGVRRLAYDPV